MKCRDTVYYCHYCVCYDSWVVSYPSSSSNIITFMNDEDTVMKCRDTVVKLYGRIILCMSSYLHAGTDSSNIFMLSITTMSICFYFYDSLWKTHFNVWPRQNYTRAYYLIRAVLENTPSATYTTRRTDFMSKSQTKHVARFRILCERASPIQ